MNFKAEKRIFTPKSNPKESMDHNNSNAGVSTSRIKFCDLQCEFADFPSKAHLDGAGSCRTFSALWCRQLQQIVTKNAPCAVLFGQRRPKASL